MITVNEADGTRSEKELKEGKDREKDNRLLVAYHVFGRIIHGMCSGGCTREWGNIHRP